MAEEREKRAAAAGKEEIQQYLHDPSASVLTALLQNPNIAEHDIAMIAGRKNISADILETIAKEKRWAESYEIRLALVRNPRSPLFVSLSVARFLRIFDLEEITRSHHLPVVLRRKIEAMLVERIPAMPLGNKKTLAKKAAGTVLLKLLQDRIADVVQLCLDNPRMAEAHLYKVISRTDTPAQTILMIAEHPIWSTRPLVRFALTRNTNTPLAVSVRFLENMKLVDLRELYSDPSLPMTVKPLVYRELLDRGNDPHKATDEVLYEIDEDETADLDAMLINDFEQPDETERREPE